MKLQKYKALHRTTFDKMGNGLPYSGIYIIAYLGKVMYIGKASEDVYLRIVSHILYAPDNIGHWLTGMKFDWHNILLDVLETPDNSPDNWLKEAEAALIRRFNPVFNIHLR